MMTSKLFAFSNPLGAVAIGSALHAFIMLSALPAIAADLTLADVTIKTATASAIFKQIVVEGGNLTREELVKVFSAEASPEIDALLARFSATRVRVPEVAIDQGSGKLMFHDLEATGIRQGIAAKMSAKGFDASSDAPGGGKVEITSRPLTMENANFGLFLRGMRNGDYAGTALRATHVLWEGFDLTFPDPKASAGSTYRFHLGSLEITSTFAADIPKATSAEVRNAVLLPPKGSALALSLAPFGYEQIDLSFKLKGSYDAGAKVFTMEEYSLTANGAGALAIRGRFENIDKTVYANDKVMRLAAIENSNVARIELSYRDAGFFESWVAATAKLQNKTAQTIKNDWIAGTPKIATGLLGNNPTSGKLSAALASFIANPATLTVSATSNVPIKISDFKQMLLPVLLSRVAVDAAATK